MQQRARRALTIGFIILFFIISVPLLAGSAGYRIDWSRLRIEKTGLLVIVSAPKPDSLTIDGDPVHFRTMPIRITSLTAGSHTVTLQKAGYRTWSNDVQIDSGKATQLEALRMLPTAAPTQLTTGVDHSAVAEKSMTALFSSRTTATFYDLGSATANTSVHLAAAVEQLFITPDGTIGFAVEETAVERITADGTIKRVDMPQPLSSFSFEPDTTDIAYGRSINERLYRFDFTNATATPIMDDVAGFRTDGRNILILHRTNTQIELVVMDGGATSVLRTFANIPGDWTIAGASGSLLPIISPDTTLSVIDRGNKDHDQTLADARTVAWSPDRSFLAIGGQLELKLYDPKTIDTFLLLRTSTPFSHILWADATHLIVHQRDECTWIELLNHELLSINRISTEAINDSMLLPNGDLLMQTTTGAIARQALQ